MTPPGIVVLGGSGLVGSALVQAWSSSAEVLAPTHAQLDVLDSAALESFVDSMRPGSVVNCIAAADVDGSEAEAGDFGGRVYRLNVEFPRLLARLCQASGTHLVHLSTDYVFDGAKAHAPYTELDPTGALCWYAETKLRGERAVVAASPDACVARIEMPFTAVRHRKRDLARTLACRLQAGQTVQAVTDQHITPVFLEHAAAALGRLAEARFVGLMHVASSTWTTPYTLATTLARHLGAPEALVEPVAFEQFAATRPARRPRHSWLDVSRFTECFGAGVLRQVEDEMDLWARQWLSQEA